MANMAGHPFEKDLAGLEQHYSQLLKECGDTPQGVQWGDVETQERRMAILLDVGDVRSAKVLDFGCGTGHLLNFMQRQVGFKGEYIGYDIGEDMIRIARKKFPGIRFERRDILAQGIGEVFDYILINGVFNNLVDDNWGLMKSILRCLFHKARRALAFNALSTYVDYFDPGLFYVSPNKVFSFCKEELSSRVILRHDYLIKSDVVPFEFSVYVYASEISPRKSLGSPDSV
jgi:SAM-dependent methyltransferase